MQKFEHNLAANISGALRPLPGAAVTVTADATGLPAALYSDNGVTPLPQPLTTDNTGYFAFHAADGKYTLTFSGPRFETFTREIVLEDPQDNPYATLSQLAAPSGSSLISHGGVPLDEVLEGLAAGGGSGAVDSVNSVAPTDGNVVLTTDNLPESGEPANKWFTEGRVRATLLTGLPAFTDVPIAAGDTVLAALAKLQGEADARQKWAMKDAASGYPALTATYSINLKNAAGTVISTLSSAATAPRNWIFPDKDGSLALLSDLAGGAPPLAQITVIPGSPVATLDFLNLFSDTYSKYVIEVEGAVSSGTDALCIRAAVGGTVLAGGADYNNGTADGALSAASSSVIFGASSSHASHAVNLTIEVRNARSATRYKSIGGRGAHYASATMREGTANTLSALSGFRLQWVGGSNFTAGTARVYGIKNS